MWSYLDSWKTNFNKEGNQLYTNVTQSMKFGTYEIKYKIYEFQISIIF